MPLTLAGLFVGSACSVGAFDLAVVPDSPLAPAPARAGAATPTPSPAVTPEPAVAPEPVVAAEPEVRVTREKAGKKKAAADVTVVKLKPRPKAGPFEMNLFTKGDFMHQATKDMCVAGSTQIMMNVIDTGKPNQSVAFQKNLYSRGRELSPNKTKLGSIGVDLTGWAELLNTRGYGPYEVESAETRRGAIRKAAKAIRETGRPVGLVVWRGAHSWVMTGFSSTADPALSLIHI